MLTISKDIPSATISRLDLNQAVDDYDLAVEYSATIFARNQHGKGPESAILFTVVACE